jgi:hypothetical protein
MDAIMLKELNQKIKVRDALKAFELVRLHGEKEDQTPEQGAAQMSDSYRLYGLTVSSDYDGYNIVLSDARVRLHIFFHNKFECKYDSASALDAFISKIESVISHFEGM